ncbi:MAG: AAA family ATPase [Rhodothermales bacterium]
MQVRRYDTLTEADVDALLRKLAALRREIGKVIIGQQQAVEELLTTFVAGGHCLLEGVPGLAKTLMIRTLAEAVHLSFSRIQFTPDLMPTDIIGTEVLEEDHTTGRRFFKFNKGPVFANVLLADEINRTPPKTQAALLEAMQEFEVTYGGETYPLERPFFVLATQNPIEQAGTYPLPEAQLDRFLLYITIEYPGEEEELEVLTKTTGSLAPSVEPVITAEEVLSLQALARDVTISKPLLAYVNRLIRATRPSEQALDFVKSWVRWGAGPRAGQALILTAKARALLQGRFSVTLDDLRAMAYPALRHRVLVNFKAEAEGITSDDVTRTLFDEVPEPRSPLV